MVNNVQRKHKSGNQGYVFDLGKVRSIPLHLRTNIRTLSCQLGEHKSTVHRLIQLGKIKSHSNVLKPYLILPKYEGKSEVCLKSYRNTQP